jgi:osmotically-inducible protein OsmY
MSIRINILFKLNILFLLFFLFSHCTPQIAVGTASTAIAVSKEERTLGEFIDDTLIKTQIKNLYFDTNENIFFNVDVEVTQGRVLLTGTLDNSDLRIEATRMAWGINGVQTVINELQISNDDSILNFADDLVISAKIKAKLLINSELPYLNYTVETVNGIVYLIGIASSEGERQAVIDLSNEIYGVVDVIDYIEIKSDSY